MLQLLLQCLSPRKVQIYRYIYMSVTSCVIFMHVPCMSDACNRRHKINGRSVLASITESIILRVESVAAFTFGPARYAYEDVCMLMTRDTHLVRMHDKMIRSFMDLAKT